MAGLGDSFDYVPRSVRIYDSTCSYKQEENNMDLFYRGTSKIFYILLTVHHVMILGK